MMKSSSGYRPCLAKFYSIEPCGYFSIHNFNKKSYMPYDEKLAVRLYELLKDRKNFIRKKMFGGVGYMVNGNMCADIHKDHLIIRCDPADTDALLAEKTVKVFDITGKPMKGWLLISPEGLKENGLQTWVEHSLSYVNTLPSK